MKIYYSGAEALYGRRVTETLVGQPVMLSYYYRKTAKRLLLAVKAERAKRGKK